jgi:hypothetical protein
MNIEKFITNDEAHETHFKAQRQVIAEVSLKQYVDCPFQGDPKSGKKTVTIRCGTLF